MSTTPNRHRPADSAPAGSAPGNAAPGNGTPNGRDSGSGRRRSRTLTLGLVAVVVAAAIGSSAFLLTRHQNATPSVTSGPRLSGLPSNVSTSIANLMELEPLPSQAAPGFTLTDQAGRKMSLASLRGKIVVLEFMDPHCTDICPIVSQEFVDAYHDLGPLASKVVFAAVNVNQFYRSTSVVAAFSREHQLTAIPSWHFFTGPVPALKKVWQDYHITVQAPHPNADIVHTSAVFFIDPQGHEKYLASPQVNHTSKGAAYLPPGQITSWGKGIALVVRHMAG